MKTHQNDSWPSHGAAADPGARAGASPLAATAPGRIGQAGSALAVRLVLKHLETLERGRLDIELDGQAHTFGRDAGDGLLELTTG